MGLTITSQRGCYYRWELWGFNESVVRCPVLRRLPGISGLHRLPHTQSMQCLMMGLLGVWVGFVKALRVCSLPPHKRLATRPEGVATLEGGGSCLCAVHFVITISLWLSHAGMRQPAASVGLQK